MARGVGVADKFESQEPGERCLLLKVAFFLIKLIQMEKEIHLTAGVNFKGEIRWAFVLSFLRLPKLQCKHISGGLRKTYMLFSCLHHLMLQYSLGVTKSIWDKSLRYMLRRKGGGGGGKGST